MINYDFFSKLDIRIGTILSAEKIEGADKLLRLEVDIGLKPSAVADGSADRPKDGLGEERDIRQLVAGIAEHTPYISALVGKQIPVLANLEPRTLRGVESQGMILAASDENGIVLLHPERPVTPGSKVK